MTVIVLTSGTSWTVPADWTNTNQIETWGPGGNGGMCPTNQNTPGGGGGSGGYSSSSNLTGLSGSITIQIGAGDSGNPTYFNGTSLATSSVGSNAGANVANGVATGGAGGSTTGAQGTTVRAGQAGGLATSSSPFNGGGGGGASGPDGRGIVGGAGNGTTGGDGGAGDNGLGGAGGAGGPGSGTGDGTAGTANVLGGGGGGGGNNLGSQSFGAPGGLPGGGGGGDGAWGDNVLHGTGAGGQIRITYTPAAAPLAGATFPTDIQIVRYPTVRGAKDTNRWDYFGWQEGPLAASGPPTMALGFVWEVPYNSRAWSWIKHSFSGWLQSPLSSDAIPANPPEPVYDLPQRGRQKASFDGWLQAPLSADSQPEIRPQPQYVPERNRAQQWIKYDFGGWQLSPTVPELDIICRWWYDLPVRTWKMGRFDYTGWQRGVIPDEYLVPLPLTDLPVRTWTSGKQNYQGWSAKPIPADVVQPPPQPFYDLPVTTWRSGRSNYQGMQLAPQPEIMSPPAPSYAVPWGKFNAARYQDWQRGVIPNEYVVPPPVYDVPRGVSHHSYVGFSGGPLSDSVSPPLPASMWTDLPPVRLSSRWNGYQFTVAVAPAAGNVAPAIPSMWLPLLGVGNQGP